MFNLDKLKGKRVAITGGAGFIGHNLALKLMKLGAEPHVIDGLQVNNIGYYTSDPYAKNDYKYSKELKEIRKELRKLDKETKSQGEVVDWNYMLNDMM